MGDKKYVVVIAELVPASGGCGSVIGGAIVCIFAAWVCVQGVISDPVPPLVLCGIAIALYFAIKAFWKWMGVDL